MLKLIIGLSTVVAASVASADSNDFGKSNQRPDLKPQEIRERLQVDGDIAVSSADGTKLRSVAGEFRTWRFGPKGDKIASNWSFETDEGSLKFALRHEWTVGEDGVIRVHFQAFDSMTGMDRPANEVRFGKKLRDETITVKDFSEVDWVVTANDRERAVARFRLSLRTNRQAQDAGDQEIVLSNAILSDAKTRVWGEGMSGSGKFMSIKTHLGLLALSFYPFPEASLIGTAEGQMLEVRSAGLELHLRNAKPFLVGEGVFKIYGKIDPSRKSSHPGSVHMRSSSTPTVLQED